ncbi:hypothetical protein LguiA_016659 [Lonicera macranthoides]
MPLHGIDETEDPRDAAIRESREEAGVTFTSAEILAEFLARGPISEHLLKIRFLQQAPYWLTYDFPKEVMKKLKHQW